jgi:hypothetical protein
MSRCSRYFDCRPYSLSPRQRLFSTTVQTTESFDLNYPYHLTQGLMQDFTIKDILRTLPEMEDGRVIGLPVLVSKYLADEIGRRDDFADLTELMNLFESGRFITLLSLKDIAWIQPPPEFVPVHGTIYHYYIQACIRERAGETDSADTCRFLYRLVCSISTQPNRYLVR